jgi:hypothetical protein
MKPLPEQLPDPWLFDSEALLRELARTRELMQQVSITNANATHFGLQIAINANWNLEENLRYILHLLSRATTRKSSPTRPISDRRTPDRQRINQAKDRPSSPVGADEANGPISK